MAVAMTIKVEIDKRSRWLARPAVIDGESKVTSLTIEWPTELASYSKYVDFQTQDELTVLIDGVPTETTTLRMPYTDGMLLEASLLSARVQLCWPVAVLGDVVFKGASLEFPLLGSGINATEAIPEPIDTIVTAAVDETGHLIFTKLDTSTIDAGSVIGPQGEQGVQGIQGIQGVQG